MSSRTVLRAAALALVAAACRSETPKVGDEIVLTPRPEPGMRVQLSSATVNRLSRALEVTFIATRDGVPLPAADVEALGLGFTLAALETQSVDGAPAWRSLLLNGRQTLASLPVAGPETPPENVLSSVRQPGVDVGGTYAETGVAGAIRYTYAAPLPDTITDTTTLRAGAFLESGAVSAATSTTIDFRPDNQSAQRREVVVDTDCQRCHVLVSGHDGTRTGTKLCVTCHTWQHADPDTVDPNAPLAATGATNPNPLEFGRLVHRIHRGKNLPTLYKASADVATNPNAGKPPPWASAPPLPFFGIVVPGMQRSNALSDGKKFSVIGDYGRERVFGRAVTRYDNGMTVGKLINEGILFPRDLRHCDVCHLNAKDGDVTVKELSRRTCQSCHADVYFGDWAPGTTDEVHFPHTGGPVTGADADTKCAGCHGPNGSYVRLADVHVPPVLSDRYNHLEASIVRVDGMKATPVGTPATPVTVYFTLSDSQGPVSPLGLPDVPSASGHPIARAMLTGTWPNSNPTPGTGSPGISFTLAGPTSDYSWPSNDGAAQTEQMPLLASGVPLDGTTADLNGVFHYTLLKAKLPEGATGTWAVGFQTARTNAVDPAAYWYDAANDRFTWPYTGELLRETAYNPVAYVDVASGLTSEAEARRDIVTQEQCERCHLKLTNHGNRHSVRFCVMCHAPDKADWSRRVKLAPSGNVNLAGVYDGIEERSMHWKMMVHRIHTGARKGSAELSAIQPFIMHVSQPYFFDKGEFPNDLKNCKLCHAPGTYTIESVPSNASPTIANESASILHAASPVHTTCRSTPPVTAACTGCHATNTALSHAARYVVNGKETCVSCHGANGAQGVARVHGVVEPATTTTP
jgi:OmcA/MtrC family decaheme c-type cytochrome